MTRSTRDRIIDEALLREDLGQCVRVGAALGAWHSFWFRTAPPPLAPHTCKREVAAAEAMFRAERIPTLSTTHTSIEEISSKVLTTLGLQREMF